MVEKRILKSGICNRKIDRKGGISDIKSGQKSGILIQDFLQKGGMHQVNNSDFGHYWKGRLALKTVEEYAFFKNYSQSRFTSRRFMSIR